MNITQLTDLYGIGPATAETLDEYGIADAADLVRTYLGSDGTPRKVKLIRETVSAKTMSQAIHRADVRNNDLVMGVENDRYSMVRQMAFVRQFHLSTNYVTDPPESWLRSGGTQDQTYIHTSMVGTRRSSISTRTNMVGSRRARTSSVSPTTWPRGARSGTT